MKPAGSGLLFVTSVLIATSISLLVIDLFRFYISAWFSLEGYIDLEIYTFLLDC